MLRIDLIKQRMIEKYSDHKGITDKIMELSKETGIRYANIYRIFKSKTCSLESLILISKALELSLDDIVIVE